MKPTVSRRKKTRAIRGEAFFDFRSPSRCIRRRRRYSISASLEATAFQDDFEALGFAEIWAVDFSDAYYSPAICADRLTCFASSPPRGLGFIVSAAITESPTDESTRSNHDARNIGAQHPFPTYVCRYGT